MGFYERRLFPKLLNKAMRAPALTALRERLVPMAEGNVLEVGIGSGLNLPYYDPSVRVTGLDPSLELQAYAREVADRVELDVEFLGVSGEAVPAADNTFDSVVMTWTLCTIPDPDRALAEIRRVLKPGGKVIFAEHGEAPDDRVCAWQRRLNPLWRKIGAGCNLNRRIESLYRTSGFTFQDIERRYLPGPKIATYNCYGIAALR